MSVEQSKNVYMVYEHPFSISHFKNVKKVWTKKNYTHIFSPSLDSNPRTFKMLQFSRLAPKLSQPRWCIWNWVIIFGVIQNIFLSQISNLCLKKPQWFRGNILTCICSTIYELQHIFAEMRGTVPKKSCDLFKNYLFSKLGYSEARIFFDHNNKFF